MELTLQIALDEDYASELSNKSKTEIQKASRSAAAIKPESIHYEDVDTENRLDKDIHCLKSQTEKSFTNDKTTTTCIGCSGNI
ncbi:hypothetical protein E2320_010757 [Naja naja]|nr:hypothetical protein E2320_010757 [Naja naja]